MHSRWCYLYRCIDRDGNLVDAMLSETRDLAAATHFFRRARRVVGHLPERMTTDGHDAYPRAIRRLRNGARHRCSRYLNNRIEQDHRAIKQRYYPMWGFGTFEAAARFCLAHEELRAYLRPSRGDGRSGVATRAAANLAGALGGARRRTDSSVAARAR